MRANPGGQIAPDEVLGRESLIASLWRTLERQSVVLTAERRMGKTQVIKKMKAESPPSMILIYRDLEGVRTPLEFVEIVFRDVETFLGTWQRNAQKARQLLAKLGGGEAVGVKIPENMAAHWKSFLHHTIEDLVQNQSEQQVVFLWDELPLMLQNICATQGEPVAMELLDALRSLRQTHSTLRMVYTGSIGLHHVLSSLRSSGYVNPSTNDMKTVEVLPLAQADAEGLAMELLIGESLQAPHPGTAARTIAAEADCVPYYIHHIVDDLATRCVPAEPEQIRSLVAMRLLDPQDPWELQHYTERIPRYYRPGEAPLALLILDALAEETALNLDAVFAVVQSRSKANDIEPTRKMVRLLQRDHYIYQNPDAQLAFRLQLVKRAWRVARALGGA